ncbi:MAG: glycerophosphodiester phosphodiesterase [Acidimicrobiales bacterium]
MRANPFLDRRVIAYAHQGGAREAPSSTVAAIGQALRAGATAIELDVHATRDGHLVVCHDATLERTTNGSGAIRHHTLAELAELDNAYWFVPGEDVVTGREPGEYPLRGRAPADSAYRIAALAEILEAFPGVLLNLDIKQTAPEVTPYEEPLAELLRRYGRRDDVIVASFSDRATDSFRKLAPEIPTSAGTNATAELVYALRAGRPAPESLSCHVAVQVPAAFGEVPIVDEAFVKGAHAAGLAVHVWTIDEPSEMEALLDVGVDGIISDVPSVLVGVLGERDLAWKAATTGS